MELSTSLNLLNCEPRLPVVQQLKILKDCGFHFFDMNFCDYNNPNSPLVLPGWEKWIMQIKDFADQEGLSFYQSHGHMFEFYPDDRENNALIDRTIAASGLLAVKWIVFHPYHQRSKMDDENQNRTKEKFKHILELAGKHNVGVAIENMPAFYEGNNGCPDYCSDIHELIELVDSFQSDNVGICWDTSHGNLCVEDQAKCLHLIGSRLKALHISDNFQKQDDHMAPFYGTVKWPSIMLALSVIHYQGTFSFETHQFTNRLPLSLRPDAIRLLHRIGEYLIKGGCKK